MRGSCGVCIVYITTLKKKSTVPKAVHGAQSTLANYSSNLCYKHCHWLYTCIYETRFLKHSCCSTEESIFCSKKLLFSYIYTCTCIPDVPYSGYFWNQIKFQFVMFCAKLKRTKIFSVRKNCSAKKVWPKIYSTHAHARECKCQYSSNTQLAWICTAISSPPGTS